MERVEDTVERVRRAELGKETTGRLAEKSERNAREKGTAATTARNRSRRILFEKRKHGIAKARKKSQESCSSRGTGNAERRRVSNGNPAHTVVRSKRYYYPRKEIQIAVRSSAPSVHSVTFVRSETRASFRAVYCNARCSQIKMTPLLALSFLAEWVLAILLIPDTRRSNYSLGNEAKHGINDEQYLASPFLS